MLVASTILLPRHQTDAIHFLRERSILSLPAEPKAKGPRNSVATAASSPYRKKQQQSSVWSFLNKCWLLLQSCSSDIRQYNYFLRKRSTRILSLPAEPKKAWEFIHHSGKQCMVADRLTKTQTKQTTSRSIQHHAAVLPEDPAFVLQPGRHPSDHGIPR